MKKKFFQKAYNFIGIPLRLAFLPDQICEKIGLASLEQERLGIVLQYVQGELLDVGCGNNRLVNTYGNGVGVDIYDWGGGAVIIESAACLPFDPDSFDTVTLLACLNHIPERENIFKGINRVLRNNGKVIVTMINPIVGYVGHKIWWYGEDRERGMELGEVYGLWNKDIIKMFDKNGFELELHIRFLYWMNNLFIFRKKPNIHEEYIK